MVDEIKIEHRGDGSLFFQQKVDGVVLRLGTLRYLQTAFGGKIVAADPTGAVLGEMMILCTREESDEFYLEFGTDIYKSIEYWRMTANQSTS